MTAPPEEALKLQGPLPTGIEDRGDRQKEDPLQPAMATA